MNSEQNKVVATKGTSTRKIHKNKVKKKTTSKERPIKTISKTEKKIRKLAATPLFEKIYNEFVAVPEIISELEKELKEMTLDELDETLKDQKVRTGVYEYARTKKYMAMGTQNQDAIISNITVRKTHASLSNWRRHILTKLITNVPLKAPTLVNDMPLSGYIQDTGIKSFNRPYNNQDVAIPKLIQNYRTDILFQRRRTEQNQEHTEISPYVRKFSEQFKSYKQDLKRIASTHKRIPYAQLLGHSIGKLNNAFLPWVRNRGEGEEQGRAYEFLRKGQRKYLPDEITPYAYLLNKRRRAAPIAKPSVFRPSVLKLSRSLTKPQRATYVLAQLKQYPIKVQSLLLKIHFYS